MSKYCLVKTVKIHVEYFWIIQFDYSIQEDVANLKRWPGLARLVSCLEFILFKLDPCGTGRGTCVV